MASRFLDHELLPRCLIRMKGAFNFRSLPLEFETPSDRLAATGYECRR
jgi:hypothetical protein